MDTRRKRNQPRTAHCGRDATALDARNGAGAGAGGAQAAFLSSLCVTGVGD
jgi:hypothetical protein